MRFLRTAGVCLLVLTLCRASELADAYYKAAQKAEKAGDLVNAYLLYVRAAELDPHNPAFAQKKTSLRLQTARSIQTELGPDPAGFGENPSIETDITGRDQRDTRQALPPPKFAGSKEKKSFHLKGDARSIFEQVLQAYGVQAVFEADYQSPPQFLFQLDDASFEDALRALEIVSNSFVVPLNPRLALVARDTQAKRNEHMPVVAATIPVAERFSAQDAQEMMTAVQQSLDIRRAQFDPGRHQVVLRAEADKVAAARELFAILSQIRPQVQVDVQFLEVDKTSSLGYGIGLPNQISVVDFLGPMTIPAAYSALRRLTGPNTPYGIGIGNATILATLARASATDLLDAQMIALDGQAATLHVGEHYPIASTQYIGSTAGQTGQVYAPPPNIDFVDLGLVMKVTPSMHDDHEITLDVESEFKTLGAVSAVAGIPVINNRSYKGKLRLHEGEWAVIAGLVQHTDSETRTGWPGLIRIPLLGRLFSQNMTEHDSSQVLLVLKPYVLSAPAWDNPTKGIWVGSETRPVGLF